MVKQEDIDEIWEDDLLDRMLEAKFLHDYLVKSSQEPRKALDRGSFVVNLKAEWGSGKTFFLKRFARQLRKSGKLVVEIDAWKADPDIDPLVTIVAGIKNYVDEEFGSSVPIAQRLEALQRVGGAALRHVALGAAKQAAKKLFGDGIDAAGAVIADLDTPQIELDSDDVSKAAHDSADSLVDETFRQLSTGSYFKQQIAAAALQQAAIERFCRNMEKLANDIDKESDDFSPPIFIVIDELDRCRPLYAIRLLERVNHLFDSEGVVFIIGTDSDELSHSVGAIYGTQFDAKKYLERFFSYTYHLVRPERSAYIQMLFDDLRIDFDKFIAPYNCAPSWCIEQSLLASDLTPRDLRRVLFALKTFSDAWNHASPIDAIYAIACSLVVVLGTEEELKNLNSNDFSSTSIARKFDTLSLEYHGDDDGRRKSTTFKSHVDKLSGLGATSLEFISQRLQGEHRQFRSYVLSLTNYGTFRRKIDGLDHHSPTWRHYTQLLQSTSRLEEAFAIG